MDHYENGNDVQATALPLKATLHLPPLPFHHSLLSSLYTFLFYRLPFPAVTVRSNSDISSPTTPPMARTSTAHPPPLLHLPCVLLRLLGCRWRSGLSSRNRQPLRKWGVAGAVRGGSGLYYQVAIDDATTNGRLAAAPAVASLFQTYDRSFIHKWLKSGNRTCPRTQQVLSHTILTPNQLIRDMISQWCKINGIQLPDPVHYLDDEGLTEADPVDKRFLSECIISIDKNTL